MYVYGRFFPLMLLMLYKINRIAVAEALIGISLVAFSHKLTVVICCCIILFMIIIFMFF